MTFAPAVWPPLLPSEPGGPPERRFSLRVWLTCLALRAITVLNPYAPELETGAAWLMANREPRDSAWGETRHGPSTVTHTAFALLTLAELGRNGPSLWSVWWCLEALVGLRRHSEVRAGDVLIWLPKAVVLQRAEARDQPLETIVSSDGPAPRRGGQPSWGRLAFASSYVPCGAEVSGA